MAKLFRSSGRAPPTGDWPVRIGTSHKGHNAHRAHAIARRHRRVGIAVASGAEKLSKSRRQWPLGISWWPVALKQALNWPGCSDQPWWPRNAMSKGADAPGPAFQRQRGRFGFGTGMLPNPIRSLWFRQLLAACRPRSSRNNHSARYSFSFFGVFYLRSPIEVRLRPRFPAFSAAAGYRRIRSAPEDARRACFRDGLSDSPPGI
jgi:hypothetical protein